MNEGFGKKWIDKILGKVDKDQGIANAGKVLGIGNDGQVTPVAQSGGGESSSYAETFTSSMLSDIIINSKVKVGDSIILKNLQLAIAPSISAGTISISTSNNSKIINGSPSISYGGIFCNAQLNLIEAYNDTFYYMLSSPIELYPNDLSGTLTVGEDEIPYITSCTTVLDGNKLSFGKLSLRHVFKITLGSSTPYIPSTYVYNKYSTIESVSGVIIHN